MKARCGPLHLAAVVMTLWCTLGSGAAQSLPDDRNQPIYIQSDRAERDERKGTTVYTGDVQINQGSLHISADRVTIAMQGNQVNRIDASGNPARIDQKPAADQEPVKARARTLQYDVQTEVLILTGQASVTQEGSTVNGERIEYYMQEQRVKASAGSTRPGGAASRVQMVIQPRHSQPQAQPPAEESSPGSPPPAATQDDGNAP